VSLITFFVF